MQDERIIALFFERNEQAIKEATDSYGGFLKAVSCGILHSDEDASECLSDTMMKAWQTIPPQKPNNLKAYLGRIIRNLSLDVYDKRQAQKRGSGAVCVQLDELCECIPSSENVTGSLEHKELSQAISEFLIKQKKKQRILFVQRYWYMLSIKEIADKNKMSESAVKMSLQRTRNNLKNKLSDSIGKEW